MNHEILRIESVRKSFETLQGEHRVLKGVSYTFSAGHSYAITGASGTGKSTLLHILAHLIEPSQGSVFLNEQNMALFDVAARQHFLNTKVGLLFQRPYLIKELTVLENVMTKGFIAVGNRASTNEAVMLLEKMGLSDKMHQKPPTLSGGQQQRVALARALFSKPLFLLADEPTGSLDPHIGSIIVDLLLESQKEWGMGIIVSTHDQYVARRMQKQLNIEDGLLKKRA